MQTITYQPTGINNFHGVRPVRLRPQGTSTDGAGHLVLLLSARQAARLRRHFCGMTDCHCPHGAVAQEDEAGNVWSVPARYAAPR